jgi:hypothetical protein
MAPITMSQFGRTHPQLQERYAPEALAAMLNLFGSHDTSRGHSLCSTKHLPERPTSTQNPDYDWSDAIAD